MARFHYGLCRAKSQTSSFHLKVIWVGVTPSFVGCGRAELGPLRADFLRALELRAAPALMPSPRFEPEVLPVVEDDCFDLCPGVFVAAADAAQIIVVLQDHRFDLAPAERRGQCELSAQTPADSGCEILDLSRLHSRIDG